MNTWTWPALLVCIHAAVSDPAALLPSNVLPTSTVTKHSPDQCYPLIIAHSGASGYVPEHTLGAYALAITMGADYVEPDIVSTKDGKLVARHDNELGLTTDVAQRPEFASRRRLQTVDGLPMYGWFTEDFTLAELKTLRAIERIPDTRSGNARANGAFEIPTLEEIIALVKGMETSLRRTIGIYPEIKHSTHFKRLQLPIEEKIVDILHKNGYVGVDAPIYIQSFEVSNLKELKNITSLKLLQLYGSSRSKPFDQRVAGSSLTYGDMATPEGLLEVAKYAYATGPDKSYIIPRDANNRLGTPTDFVKNAHKAGLRVHPYTFRTENTFLPAEFRSSDLNADFGDYLGELKAFLATGIDGLFADQPDKIAQLRGPCL